MKIFISYSHADELYCKGLEKHLSSMRRVGAIQTWYARKIEPGSAWQGEIDTHINEADIIILLLSADFLASDYCHDVEMRRAMEKHGDGSAVVVPIIARPFDFAGMPFSGLQFLPSQGSLETAEQPNEAFKGVAEGIRKIVEKVRFQRISRYQLDTGEEQIASTRFLDACIAAEIPKGESREVTAFIRLEDSAGLKFVIEQDMQRLHKDVDPVFRGAPQVIDRVYSADLRDVRSCPFTLDFPLTQAGVMRPFEILLKINAPDFEPPEQQKRIAIPRLQDSAPYSFLLRTSREGDHVLTVELLCEQISVAEQLLRTRSVHHGGPDSKPPGGGMVLVASLPLQVTCIAKAATTSG